RRSQCAPPNPVRVPEMSAQTHSRGAPGLLQLVHHARSRAMPRLGKGFPGENVQNEPRRLPGNRRNADLSEYRLQGWVIELARLPGREFEPMKQQVRRLDCKLR